MRQPAALIGLGAVLACAACGCGTMANMDGRDALVGLPSRPPVPFGGVANDMAWMTRGNLSPPEKFDRAFTTSIALLDLPFSLVGDVITLPLATYEFTSELVSPSDRYEKFQKAAQPRLLNTRSPSEVSDEDEKAP
jgi:uncharacterized protein YceK